MVESLRKDIECLFVELKSEFAILKYGPRFGDLDLVDDVFQTCCAMHNQRKVSLGLSEPWAFDPDDVEQDLLQEEAPIARRLNLLREAGQFGDALQLVRGGLDVEGEQTEEGRRGHDTVKRRLIGLIVHFKHGMAKGEVFWPRRDGAVHVYVRNN